MRMLSLLLLLLFCLGCGGDDNDSSPLPAAMPPETVICHDMLGIGPDIPVTRPPNVHLQIKSIAGCFSHGVCYYNCDPRNK